jgi:hypothetical protein
MPVAATNEKRRRSMGRSCGRFGRGDVSDERPVFSILARRVLNSTRVNKMNHWFSSKADSIRGSLCYVISRT